MKKLLLLANEFGMPQQVLDFAFNLAQKERCKLNGLFMYKHESEPEKNDAFPNDLKLTETPLVSRGKDGRELLRANMRFFEDACSAHGQDGYVKEIDKDYSDIILDESAFSDLILSDDNMENRNFSMNSFMSASHCPVLMVPQGISFFENVIFTYDGNSSSLYAMKQFTYLFPWCSHNKVCLINAVPENILQMEYDALVREWILLHYPKAEFFLLKGEVKTQLSGFIKNHPNSLVVMGAFGRSALSRLFKESLATSVLQRTHSPLFIAHS